MRKYRKCMFCGYERKTGDDLIHASEISCPKCQAIYDDVDRSYLKKEYENTEKLLFRKENDQDSDKLIDSTINYAALGIRFCAGLIDALVLLIPAGLAKKLGDSLLGEPGGGLFLIIVCWLYYAFLESSNFQASVGKKALGLIVAASDGRKITFWKATIRFILFFVTMSTLWFVTIIMIASSKKKQGLHDVLIDHLILIKTDISLKAYKVFRHPSGSIEAVKQGWLWPAFFFIWIWAAFKKMWVLSGGVFIATLVFWMIAVGQTDSDKVGNGLATIFSMITGVVFGINASSWRERNLFTRGFEEVEIVSAKNPEGAIAHYLKAKGSGR
jgi:uncharacterized RDD family membrane protein YckC